MADVFVHPQGLCESDDVGDGTRIWAFAHVMPGARLGRDCNVCGGAFIETGAVLGDHVTVKNNVLVWDKVTVGDEVFLGPGVVFTNDLDPRAGFKKDADAFLPTTVEGGATIGANATIVCGTTIGRNGFVGAGSVVVRDVAPHALVAGNPAARIGWVCECGKRLDDSLACGCGRSYRIVDEQQGLQPA